MSIHSYLKSQFKIRSKSLAYASDSGDYSTKEALGFGLDSRLIGEFVRNSGSKLVAFSQVIAGVMSLVAVAITARYVGATTFGFCSIALLVLNIAITLMDFGSCSWASREYAAKRISLGTFKNVMWSKTKLNLSPFVFTPVFFFEPLQENRYAFLLLLYPALWTRSNYIQQFLLARSMVNEAVLLVLIDRSCWLLILPISAFNLDKTFAFTFPILIGLALQSILFSIILHLTKIEVGKTVYFKQMELFRFSKHFGAISTTGVISNFDGVVVATISSVADSSNYFLSQRFRNPLTIVFSSIVMRLRPIAARRNMEAIKNALLYDAKLILLSVVTTIGIAFFLLSYAENFLGKEFADSSIILFFGALTSIPMGVLLLTSGLLSSMGAEKIVAKVNSFYSFFILLGVAFGTFVNGSLGAVLAVLLIVSVHALIFSFELRREIKTVK